jgi:hypothetical protein
VHGLLLHHLQNGAVHPERDLHRLPLRPAPKDLQSASLLLHAGAKDLHLPEGRGDVQACRRDAEGLLLRERPLPGDGEGAGLHAVRPGGAGLRALRGFAIGNGIVESFSCVARPESSKGVGTLPTPFEDSGRATENIDGKIHF